jgi:hypothetical protein
MADITIKHLLDQALELLQDSVDRDQFDYPDLVNWYNFGQRLLVAYLPDANAVIDVMKLASGAKQSLPARGLGLINIYRNMGTDGLTPGAAITGVSLEAVKAFDLNWSTATEVQEILNYMQDPVDKTFFYNSPPSDGTGYIEYEFGQVPPIAVYDAGGVWENLMVGVHEKYVDSLLNYILHRCYEKDTDFPGNLERSMHHRSMFYESAGLPSPGSQPG